MVFDGSALRQASHAPVPLRERHVAFALVGADGRLEQAGTVAEKRELLGELQAGDGLLAAWTGQYRTDVFSVDDIETVRRAGLRHHVTDRSVPAASTVAPSASRGRAARLVELLELKAVGPVPLVVLGGEVARAGAGA